MTEIQWTEKTWNPIVGCSIESAGCTNCYAMKMAWRLEQCGNAPHYDGTTKRVNGNPVWTGKLAVAPHHILDKPRRWKSPRMIFANSMGDLFHEDLTFHQIDMVFDVMVNTPQHIYQVLTKRSGIMREYMERMPERQKEWSCHAGLDDISWPPKNIWLGVSIEDGRQLHRVRDLIRTPAAVRFLSCEPLLGEIDLETVDDGESVLHRECWGECACPVPPAENCRNGREGEVRGIDWVIAGGESGPGHRPMDLDWARSLRDQCAAAAVPFFYKQTGGRTPKSGGRLLDGREHNGMPQTS